MFNVVFMMVVSVLLGVQAGSVPVSVRATATSRRR